MAGYEVKPLSTDRVMNPSHAEAASRSHGWSLRMIEDAGHVVVVDQPDATIRSVRTPSEHLRPEAAAGAVLV